ncbi:hypothetical protein EXIGLDRAFT_242405 [Exidia glandulosa HHB12029]|uniref:Uncharacterized protein n=1 Tax=Exidia glandulosa HHB12029 TaxID=1314781 RepID=A0A165Q7S1_EXIGL|nr:hypothetical protein EXIGLDRAFT_242405 [Exidia glandulosa HHB12029]
MDVNTEVVLLRKVVKAQDQAVRDAQTIHCLETELRTSQAERDQLHDDILELKDKVEAAETRVQSLQHAARALSPANSSARATKSPARKVSTRSHNINFATATHTFGLS